MFFHSFRCGTEKESGRGQGAGNRYVEKGNGKVGQNKEEEGG